MAKWQGERISDHNIYTCTVHFEYRKKYIKPQLIKKAMKKFEEEVQVSVLLHNFAISISWA